MENKVGATEAQLFDDFEPLCRRHLDEDRETLSIHLPEFKKEQLRVRVNDHGVLKISGECPIDATKTSRFYKEIEIAKDCDPNSIHAKFVNGVLSIVMPKKVNPSTQQNASSEGDKESNSKLKRFATDVATAVLLYFLFLVFVISHSKRKTRCALGSIAVIAMAIAGYYLHVHEQSKVTDPDIN